ncbi:MAG: hypothetical protein OXD30_01530 [Bryobacterales bacterium]|nr:hypothetical protein [Bryobacterales bacterium]
MSKTFRTITASGMSPVRFVDDPNKPSPWDSQAREQATEPATGERRRKPSRKSGRSRETEE